MNDPKKLFFDVRNRGRCAYCGGRPSTRDHVPSKVLLDDPLPSDLPVVDSCVGCNGGFSKDEEYVACFLDCVIVGSTDPNGGLRKKVGKSLTRSPKLRVVIEASRVGDAATGPTWSVDQSRIQRVVLKLAQGHITYEMSEVALGAPERILCSPLCALSDGDRHAFEHPDQSAVWPEIGSRAFERASHSVGAGATRETWTVIQPNRYRYWVDFSSGAVRIVMSEYLAAEVVW